MWNWLMSVFGMLLALFLVLNSGCSAEYWAGKTTMRTELKAPGFYFCDTKDNDIDISGAAYDPNTKSFRVDSLKVKNVASVPIASEVERILATGQVQALQAQYVQAWFQGINGTLGQVLPFVGQLQQARLESQAAYQQGCALSDTFKNIYPLLQGLASERGVTLPPLSIPTTQPVSP